MDSELLSVFHDDQYESTFKKYEENYWSVTHCENFATHLSENLNGILPISPIEEKMSYFDNDLHDPYCNNVIKQNNMNFSDQTQSFMYENYSENGPTIEIISVDPNAEIEEADIDSSECDKVEYKNTNIYYETDTDDDDKKSQAMFRSRTDSSSIGDYESHTSDESDFESVNKAHFDSCSQPIYIEEQFNKNYENEGNVYSNDGATVSHIDFVGSSVMVATNNSNESIEIDTENFDLATFITEDDFIEEKLSQNSPISNEKKNNHGYESEEIVDIETIDDCNPKKNYHPKRESKLEAAIEIGQNSKSTHTNNLFEEDNVEKDPSWDPSCEKKIKCNATKIVEKQNGKYQESKPNKSATKGVKNRNNLSIKKKIQKTLHIGGKNISFFKQSSGISAKNDKINDFVKKENYIDTTKNMTNKCLVKCEINIEETKESQIDKIHITDNKIEKFNENLLVNINDIVPIKKKLNLEEYYKKRKGEHTSFFTNSSGTNTSKSGFSPLKVFKETQNGEEIPLIKNITKSKSLLIPKELYTANSSKTGLDPITEAKNKVLRMQEMKKKAAQKRLIDIAVSSKVGPVTKILPLEEIIKSNSKNFKHNQLNLNNFVNQIEYEEIIIVSVSCNTDIKIPPKFNRIAVNNDSTSLLFNISNTIEKVKSNESLKISNNSLITSIKSVVLQKTVQYIKPFDKQGIGNQSQFKMENEKGISIQNKSQIDEHGEDKIIMHLPKNRIKQKTFNVCTQTEPLPEFASLELIMPKAVRTHRSRECRNRKYRFRKKECSSLSSDSDRECDSEFNIKIRSNRYRSHSRSNGSGSRQVSPSDIYHYNNSESKLKSGSCTSDKDRDRSRHKLRENVYRTRNYSDSDHSTSSSYRSRSSSYSNRSRSRSRSRSDERKERRSGSNYYKNYKKTKNKKGQKENSPAVEERRIVYVGRIESETTKEDLKRKFVAYGPIKQITLHYKDTGMKYGFVTFEKSEDAFKAIDNGTTDVKINMYDISFGGRRAFCRQSYADLDGAATNTFQLYSYGSAPSSRNSVLSNNGEEDSFESLLKKVKQKLCASKSSSPKT